MKEITYYLWILFCGICMGAADLVPGISGGTVAFIMGIYQPLLNSIKSVNGQAIGALFRFQFSIFFQTISWKFLLVLLTGIVFSMSMLVHFFDYVLNHETYRVWLYASFTGLIVASVIFCAKQIPQWQIKHFAVLCLGAIIAFIFTGDTLSLEQGTVYRGINPWIILCGAIAICALLLPGISGSYLLTILGVYPSIIGAFADFIRGIRNGIFETDAFFILFSLLIGIVLGALLFARVVSWLMKRHPEITIASMIGFMIGAIRTIWPFWSYEYSVNSKLLLVNPEWPDVRSTLFLISIVFAVAGFGLVFILEKVAQKNA